MTGIQDIYPLSPLQRLYWIAAMRQPSTGVASCRCRIEGPLDGAAFAESWRSVVRRHDALRTAVVSDNLDAPLQVVRTESDWSIARKDLRGLTDAEQRTAIEAMASANARPFDLTQAPPLRVTLAQTEDSSWECFLDFYRGLVDGWSVGLIWNEVWHRYGVLRARVAPPAPAPAPQVRAYMEWLLRQRTEDAQDYWTGKLHGFRRSEAAILADDRLPSPSATGREYLRLSSARAAAVKSAAVDAGVTLNAFVTGVWTLAVAATAGRPDVAVAMTVSGRPAALPGSDAMVGMFTNNVPVRVRVRPSESLDECLRRQQSTQIAAQSYEHIGPDQFEAWAGPDAPRPLCESLVVSHGLESARDVVPPPELRVADLNVPLRTAYPLTLMCDTDRALAFFIDYDDTRMAASVVQALIANFRALLQTAVEHGFEPVGEVLARLPASRPLIPESLSAPEPSVVSLESAARLDSTSYGATETRLLALFRRVLGRNDVALDDDFFALGGTSIMAARLFDDVAREFGRTLPLSTLFRGATPGFLAAQIDAARTPARSVETSAQAADPCVVRIRDGALREPFFLLHGINGEVLAYGPLAAHLDAAQPVFGIQAEDLERDEVTPITLEAVAGRCVLAIQSVQPSGPYRLGGHCAGALLAFEVARQLTDRGQVVALLAIIDYEMSAPAERAALDVVVDVGRNLARWVVDDGLPSGPGELAGRLRSKTRALTMRAVGRLTGETNVRQDVRDRLGMWHVADRSVPRLERDERTFLDYVPGPYRGRVIVYRPRTAPLLGHQSDDDLGWTPFARGGVESRVVPGSHSTMLQAPLVAHLAAAIQRDLDATAREAGVPSLEEPATNSRTHSVSTPVPSQDQVLISDRLGNRTSNGRPATSS